MLNSSLADSERLINLFCKAKQVNNNVSVAAGDTGPAIHSRVFPQLETFTQTFLIISRIAEDSRARRPRSILLTTGPAIHSRVCSLPSEPLLTCAKNRESSM